MQRRHYESSGLVQASGMQVFEYLDDHTRLSSHMSEPSWKMGGGSMRMELDPAAGKAVGSHIRLAGRILGVSLSLDEVITERDPPLRKTWRTVGEPRLLVIGSYQLGFNITPTAGGSEVRVFIDYELPRRGPERVMGGLLGDFYARWCVRQMITDLVAHFAMLAPDDLHPQRRSA